MSTWATIFLFFKCQVCFQALMVMVFHFFLLSANWMNLSLPNNSHISNAIKTTNLEQRRIFKMNSFLSCNHPFYCQEDYKFHLKGTAHYNYASS